MEKLIRNYSKHIPNWYRSNHTSYSQKKFPMKTPVWIRLSSKVRDLQPATIPNNDFLTSVFRGILQHFPS